MVSKNLNVRIRSEIIKNSYLIMLNKGYKGTTINDILKETKISKGCLYYYFKSKRDIANIIIDEIIKKDFFTVWHDVYKNTNPIKSIIKKINITYDENSYNYLSTGCPLGNLISELSSVDAKFSEKTNSILKMWSLYIKKAINKSWNLGILNKNLVPEEVADFLVASIEGCILTAKSYQDKKKLRSCFDSIINYLKLISND